VQVRAGLPKRETGPDCFSRRFRRRSCLERRESTGRAQVRERGLAERLACGHVEAR